MKKTASSASENGELRNAKRLVVVTKEACCEEEKGLLDLLTFHLIIVPTYKWFDCF